MALRNLLSAHEDWQGEVGKTERHQKLTEREIEVSKEDFAKIDYVLQGGGRFGDLDELLAAERVDLRSISAVWPNSYMEE